MEMHIRAGNVGALSLMIGLAGCGGASSGGGPSPDGGLAMRMPSAAAIQVVRADTSTISVNAGPMGAIDMQVEDEGTIDVTFADDPAGVKVTATYSTFTGSMSNPMAGNISADETDIGGQLVFTLDDRAHATVHEAFDVEMEVAQMVGTKTLAYDLFPRFPAGPVMPGQSWVDTVDVEEAGEITASTTTITTYTVVGDTVVDGRTLVRLNTAGETQISTVGEQQGMSMSQELSGSFSGWMLWDPAASLTFQSYAESDMTGLVLVDMPGVPEMPLSVSGRQYTRSVY